MALPVSVAHHLNACSCNLYDADLGTYWNDAAIHADIIMAVTASTNQQQMQLKTGTADGTASLVSSDPLASLNAWH